jgi:hypothetical protein
MWLTEPNTGPERKILSGGVSPTWDCKGLIFRRKTDKMASHLKRMDGTRILRALQLKFTGKRPMKGPRIRWFN